MKSNVSFLRRGNIYALLKTVGTTPDIRELLMISVMKESRPCMMRMVVSMGCVCGGVAG